MRRCSLPRYPARDVTIARRSPTRSRPFSDLLETERPGNEMGSERQRPLRAEQFTTARDAQPFWYRAVNGLGRVLPSFGTPSAEAWFAKARRQHPGVRDPRPETLAALGALLRSVQEDAVLSFSGRIAARMDCLRMAGQHLSIERAIRETPEILGTEIPSPIFLIGWMRTGTTFVHRLLAQDPDTRTMPYWESMYPVPPGSGKDNRPGQLAHVLEQLGSISPDYGAIHPMGAHEPEEGVALYYEHLPNSSIQRSIPGSGLRRVAARARPTHRVRPVPAAAPVGAAPSASRHALRAQGSNPFGLHRDHPRAVSRCAFRAHPSGSRNDDQLAVQSLRLHPRALQ